MVSWLQLQWVAFIELWQQATGLLVLHILFTAFTSALLVTGSLYYHFRQQRSQLESAFEDELQSRTLELTATLNELEEKNRILAEQNTQDALTGCRNRAYFDKKIVAELKRSRREQRPLGIIMLDIDRFKDVNDNYGHLAGDRVIQAVAARAQQMLKRSSDQLCRYGGEEFAILLPNTTTDGCVLLAEHIRHNIAASPIAIEDTELTITISAGIFACTASAQHLSRDFIDAADKALYQAKQDGRNCVKLAPNSEPDAAISEGVSDEPIL
jgi:diguanylate cyclase (GGDEF)-like protein